MNRQQRMQNRENARWLTGQQKCPECGERGLHWVSVPLTLANVISGIPPEGFWTCPKFYGTDGSRQDG